MSAAARQDNTGLPFVAEMYGVQLDQLAAVLGCSQWQARAMADSWIERKLAGSGQLSQGPRWVWLTRAGLQACGLRYAPAPPALPRLMHIRAVIAVRLALESTPAWTAGSAHWRSERHLRARVGGRLPARDHLPDAEVHWPDDGPAPWAGECWAIEAELTPKTITRTTAIMRELLARTGDYGCPAVDARVPGQPPRHARAVYLCSPAAASTVTRARTALGSLAGRVEIRAMPGQARLPEQPPPSVQPRRRAPGHRRMPA